MTFRQTSKNSVQRLFCFLNPMKLLLWKRSVCCVCEQIWAALKESPSITCPETCTGPTPYWTASRCPDWTAVSGASSSTVTSSTRDRSSLTPPTGTCVFAHAAMNKTHTYVTLEHKTSHKGQLFKIESYTSSEAE